MNIRKIQAIPTAFETRENSEGLFIEGYFARFGSRYEMWERNAETIMPGAFRECLNEDIRALTDHDSRLVLGRTKAGTLHLREDSNGLWGRIRINPDDMDAMNLYRRVQRGDVDQCSFGFDILDEQRDIDADGNILWTLRKVKLYEVSVVTFPAYEETSVQARKKELVGIRKRQMELWKQNMILKLKGEGADGS